MLDTYVYCYVLLETFYKMSNEAIRGGHCLILEGVETFIAVLVALLVDGKSNNWPDGLVDKYCVPP